MAVSATAIARIWRGDGYRLFLSHKSEDKVEVGKLKKQFRKYGISAFVAHDDIEPTQAWQKEIERALLTMDGLAALMTRNFHNSDWTDQEIGFALGAEPDSHCREPWAKPLWLYRRYASPQDYVGQSCVPDRQAPLATRQGHVRVFRAGHARLHNLRWWERACGDVAGAPLPVPHPPTAARRPHPYHPPK